MSRRSPAPYAAPERAARPSLEIRGRFDALDVSATFVDTREQNVERSVSVLRRDDRPAGRMTLSPAS